ncbi:DNA-processing protein DprA [Clostridium butyricum]|uniref:DNA-processing protein DprA n=1 Tax=Clostridium butyricum TaxID=1492 RepID=UPI003D356619
MSNTKIILTLLNIKKVSRKTISKILKVTNFKGTNVNEIKELFDMARKFVKRIPNPDIEEIQAAILKADILIEKLLNTNINCITILDDDFPDKLLNIQDPPVILFYKGNKKCIVDNKSVAIIGSRNATKHGIKVSERLGNILGSKGFTIVSGLAKGCDEAAHYGCLAGKGRTIAVLPSSLDCIYPNSNKKLAERILKEDGCLVSEYAFGTKPMRGYFIERDRLESALSTGVIVIEATKDGGTMHTVNYALNQKKILACYKNDLYYGDSNQIEGNRNLIDNNCALPLSNKQDIELFIKNIFELSKKEPIVGMAKEIQTTLF